MSEPTWWAVRALHNQQGNLLLETFGRNAESSGLLRVTICTPSGNHSATFSGSELELQTRDAPTQLRSAGALYTLCEGVLRVHSDGCPDAVLELEMGVGGVKEREGEIVKRVMDYLKRVDVEEKMLRDELDILQRKRAALEKRVVETADAKVADDVVVREGLCTILSTKYRYFSKVTR